MTPPDAAAAAPLHLFEAIGIELEYMIVDARTLAVRPIADQLLAAAGSVDGSDVERGAVAWSNELALHVIEIKTNGPVARLGGVGELHAGADPARSTDCSSRSARA